MINKYSKVEEKDQPTTTNAWLTSVRRAAANLPVATVIALLANARREYRLLIPPPPRRRRVINSK